MKIKIIFLILASTLFLGACDENNYLKELYVKPVAKFNVPATEYGVFESVLFSNEGTAQNFVVYPGDKNHQFGVKGHNGYSTASNGTFSYSYSDPGVYNAVWVASSINENGVLETSIDSIKITVLALDGGLKKLAIFNIYKMDEYSTGGLNVYYTSTGKFISPDTLLCPILFPAWNDKTINSIKIRQLLSFELSSNNAKMYWVDPALGERELVSLVTSSRIVYFVENGKFKVQNFRVKTASGIPTDYYVAPVMIPQFTQFTINGVNGTIVRNTSSYTDYDVSLTLPVGTDLTSLTPVFQVMNNDPNLLDGTNCKVTVGGVEQISGVSVVNLASKKIDYRVDYTLLGSDNQKLSQYANFHITITIL